MHSKENLPWWRSDRPWGFRFSFIDAVIVLTGCYLGFIGFSYSQHLGYATAFVLAHFFYFVMFFG